MSSQNNEAVVLTVDETFKSLDVKCRYPHPEAVFGVVWSLVASRQFLTGCKDFKIRLFDITSNKPNAVRVFNGHSDRVYNVLFNPLLPNLFVSGSDDRSIRVWDINQTSSL
jgi:dynein intermediate chain 1